MSETDVRHEGDKLALNTNLIVHHSTMDIPNQTIEHLCILDIGEESLDLPLICQWNEFLENLSQFPDSPQSLGLDLNLKHELTVPVPSSLPPPWHHPQKWVYRAGHKGS